MIFGKKKRMIDVRELQKRGVVRIPKDDFEIPTNKDGFVELGSRNESITPSKHSTQNFFGFADTSSGGAKTERQIDSRITDLDNKIYKLEQRIELLERKAGVGGGSSNSNDGSLIGW